MGGSIVCAELAVRAEKGLCPVDPHVPLTLSSRLLPAFVFGLRPFGRPWGNAS